MVNGKKRSQETGFKSRKNYCVSSHKNVTLLLNSRVKFLLYCIHLARAIGSDQTQVSLECQAKNANQTKQRVFSTSLLKINGNLPYKKNRLVLFVWENDN